MSSDRMSWWRAHHGMPSHPRWLQAARKSGQPIPVAFSVAMWLLDHASRADKRGVVVDFDPGPCAAFLWIDEEAVQAVVQALRDIGWIIADAVASWTERQPLREDVGATERKRKQRENEALSREETCVSHTVTQCHAPEKSRVDTDKKIPNNSDSGQTDLLPVPNERAQAGSEKTKRNQYPPEFMALWSGYPTDANMSKKEAFDVWKRLPLEEREEAVKSLPAFRSYCQSNKDYRPVHLCRFLSKRRAEGFLASAEKIAGSASVFVKVGTPAWSEWREFYQETKGKDPPVSKDGGWYFSSLRPPKIKEST